MNLRLAYDQDLKSGQPINMTLSGLGFTIRATTTSADATASNAATQAPTQTQASTQTENMVAVTLDTKQPSILTSTVATFIEEAAQTTKPHNISLREQRSSQPLHRRREPDDSIDDEDFEKFVRIYTNTDHDSNEESKTPQPPTKRLRLLNIGKGKKKAAASKDEEERENDKLTTFIWMFCS